MSRQSVQQHPLEGWLTILLAASLLLGGVARAQSPGSHVFIVERGGVSLQEGVYLLEASIDFQLSDAARRALDSGVPLTFELEIELERPRTWWLDTAIASLTQRYRLRYHALSERYVLTNLNSGESRSFVGERAALRALGEVRDLPLIDRHLLEPATTYEVWLRAQLDIDELPAPLKTVAYMSPEWRLVSEWKVWRFEA